MGRYQCRHLRTVARNRPSCELIEKNNSEKSHNVVPLGQSPKVHDRLDQPLWAGSNPKMSHYLNFTYNRYKRALGSVASPTAIAMVAETEPKRGKSGRLSCREDVERRNVPLFLLCVPTLSLVKAWIPLLLPSVKPAPREEAKGFGGSRLRIPLPRVAFPWGRRRLSSRDKTAECNTPPC